MLKEGAKAPAFTLDGDEGKVSLADLRGKIAVVYFYPRDSTPGCTREAQAFSARGKELAKLGARLIIQRAVEDEFDAWLAARAMSAGATRTRSARRAGCATGSVRGSCRRRREGSRFRYRRSVRRLRRSRRSCFRERRS